MTRTVSAAGKFPVSGDAESHSAVPGLIVIVNAAALDPDFTDSAFPEGNAVPDCQLKASEVGSGTRDAGCPHSVGQKRIDPSQSAMKWRTRKFTLGSSVLHRPG